MLGSYPLGCRGHYQSAAATLADQVAKNNPSHLCVLEKVFENAEHSAKANVRRSVQDTLLILGGVFLR